MGLIALACVVGTIIQQDTPQAVQRGERHGPLATFLGLHRLYGTWWFLGLLALFALSTTACALSRLRFQLRSLGSAMVHLSLLFIVAGVVLRGLVGLDSYVAIPEGETVDSIQVGDDTVPLGFQLRLDDFEVRRHGDGAEETRWLFLKYPGVHAEGAHGGPLMQYVGTNGSDALMMKFSEDTPTLTAPFQVGKPLHVRLYGTRIEVLRYLPDFKMPMTKGGEPYSASEEPSNPAIQVRVTSPGPLDAYVSRVTISGEPGREPRAASILVNQPLRAGSFMFYQVDYDHETERGTVLEAVYDPGVPLVFIGFILMPAGIAFVFYVQPLLKRRRGRPEAATRENEYRTPNTECPISKSDEARSFSRTS